ncbi:MAG TPA: hypothetical protein VGM43_14215 [Bryobacteraceae bacterium]|jgi:hypothetical protein
MKNILLSFGMAIALTGMALATPLPVEVVFEGTYGTAVLDHPGGVAVTPYEVSINNVIQVVTCYDIQDAVEPGNNWQAYEYTLDDAIAGGMFSTGFGDATLGYKSVGWLSAQTYVGTDAEVGLQYAIWDVFGSPDVGSLTTGQLTEYNHYESILATAVGNNFTGFDFSHTTYLEPTTGAVGADGTKQPFVFAITSGGGDQTSAPEPGTMVMIGSGLLCLLSSVGFKRFSRKRS